MFKKNYLNNLKCCLILLAAGKSSRFLNGKIKKQFIKINNKILIEFVLEKFLKLSFIKQLILVISKKDLKKVKIILKKYKNILFVIGGKERYNSVYNASKFVKKSLDCVIIHDVARPLISLSLIKKCLKHIKKYDCVIPAVRIEDTVKLVNNNLEVVETLDRSNLVLVQTPQILKLKVFKKIYSKENFYKNIKNYKITDDSYLAQLNGFKTKIVLGEKINFKITTKQDLNLLKYYLGNKKCNISLG